MLILLLVLVFRIWVLAPRRRIHSGGGKYFPAAPASLLLSSNLTRELHTPNLKSYSDPISSSKTLPHSADSSKEKKTLRPTLTAFFFSSTQWGYCLLRRWVLLSCCCWLTSGTRFAPFFAFASGRNSRKFTPPNSTAENRAHHRFPSASFCQFPRGTVSAAL